MINDRRHECPEYVSDSMLSVKIPRVIIISESQIISMMNQLVSIARVIIYRKER